MPTRSIRSSVPSRITNALPRGDLDRVVQGRGERGEDLEGFADVAEHRGRADAEPGGEVGVGLALAQVRQHQQGLTAGGQAPVGAENPVTSCDLHVLVDEAAEPVSSERPDGRAGTWRSAACGRALIQ